MSIAGEAKTFSGISDGAKTMITILIVVVTLLIIYGVIEVFSSVGSIFGKAGDAASDAANAAKDAVAAASNQVSNIADIFANPAMPIGSTWAQLIAKGNMNPIQPDTWTGGINTTTSQTAIVNYANAIGAITDQPAWDVLQSFNNIIGQQPGQIIGIINGIPSQADIARVVSSYNSGFKENLYTLVSQWAADQQNSLASAILSKPLTV